MKSKGDRNVYDLLKITSNCMVLFLKGLMLPFCINHFFVLFSKNAIFLANQTPLNKLQSKKEGRMHF